MANISTTIKKIYYDAILRGDKRIEYKEMSDFWKARFLNGEGKLRQDFEKIILICGQNVARFEVHKIKIIGTPPFCRPLINTPKCFAIYLGEQIFEEN